MLMMLPCSSGACRWTSGRGVPVTFVPNGRKRRHGASYAPNRTHWASDDTWSARLFVGFNVGQETAYDMEDLVHLVRRVREQQTGDPSSSFVYQKGIYRHAGGEVVEEPGAQVIIINMGESPEVFADQMVALGEAIAADMQQEEVVVELQRNGIVQRVVGVGP